MEAARSRRMTIRTASTHLLFTNSKNGNVHQHP